MQVYLIRNTVNGKWYVGATSGTLAKRWKGHRDAAVRGVQVGIAHAIRKYGAAAFTLETVADGFVTEQEMFAAEVFAIALYRLIEQTAGYNMTPGGDGGALPPESLARMAAKRRGVKASSETCAKQSEAMRRAYSEGRKACRWWKIHPMLGRKHTVSARAKQSAAHSLLVGEKNPFYGKRHSEETRRRISETKQAQAVALTPEERRRKFGKKHKSLTPEQRAKLSAAVRAAWLRRKENK